MTSSYRIPITIENAISKIVERKILLPAIQRKFVWDSSQICVLFDSIMRKYPINTFMFWEVKNEDVIKDNHFYNFLENYCERFGENNREFGTEGHKDFFAVIDGQQRLNSLYIGLKGSYAYKLPRKWWPSTQDDDILPPRTLYLNLCSPLDNESEENKMYYEFKFLTEHEFQSDKNNGKNFWFKVGEILNFEEQDTTTDLVFFVNRKLADYGLSENKYASKTLCRLYEAIRLDQSVHYYCESKQSLDHVLDIFLRTNHGGTHLSFSDLLMSIAVANWKSDARQKIDLLVQQVQSGNNMGFAIDRDFILKTSLVLTDANVQFKVKNFTPNSVRNIEQNWNQIRSCVLSAFQLVKSLGFNENSLSSKNAVIPIAYYLFKHELYLEINKKSKHGENRKIIAQWLHMSLLKRVFSGQSDTVLTNLRKVIEKNLSIEMQFPLNAIIAEFRGTTKDLKFDDEFIERLLATQKNDQSCFSILALLFPDLDYTQSLDIDHLHPEDAFKNIDVGEIPQNQLTFYEDSENWNSIVNLCLLSSSINRQKGNKSLHDWIQNPKIQIDRNDLLIPPQVDLRFKSYKKFFKARKSHLITRIKQLIGEI